MRILHIIGSMDPASGGPCQGIRNSHPDMKRLGVTREIASLDDPHAAFLGHDDFIIHPLGPAKGLWRYSSKLIPWMVENIERFDVIIVNGLWLFSSYACWRALKTLQTRKQKKDLPKMFVMPHGMLDPYFQLAPDRKLKAIRNWVYWKMIERKVVNDAYGLLFTCETELLLARDTFRPYHPNKEINVGYGIIAPPVFSPAMRDAFREKCPELKDEPYLLFLSRIHEKKGIDMLINSYEKVLVQAQHEGKAVPELVIAGPGLDSPFGRKMYQMVKQSPLLRGTVFFPGMLTGDAKWGALYGCEAFILPSHQENFGIAVAEALACGKPVLISNQVNIWMEINEAGAGIIAQDSNDGTRKLLDEWLVLGKEERKVMGERALWVYKEHFNVELFSAVFLKAVSS